MFIPNRLHVEILLRLFYNFKDGETERQEVEKSKFFETKKELAEKFKGCTFTQVQVVWIDKDIEYSDVNMGFYIERECATKKGLSKAWIGYTIAKKKEEHESMRYYAS